MTRFFKNRQTFFAFFRFPPPLHLEAAAVCVFCGAFDYDTVFSTSSTSRGFFFPAVHFDQLATLGSASSPSFSAEPSVMTQVLEADQDRRAFFIYRSFRGGGVSWGKLNHRVASAEPSIMALFRGFPLPPPTFLQNYCRAIRMLAGSAWGQLVRNGLMSSPPRRV